MRRQIVEALERRKDAMVAALWSNSNWDDDKGTRKNAIDEIEAQYEEVSYQILSRTSDEEEEIDPDNPFFQAAQRGQAKLETPRNDEGTVAQVIAFPADIDQ